MSLENNYGNSGGGGGGGTGTATIELQQSQDTKLAQIASGIDSTTTQQTDLLSRVGAVADAESASGNGTQISLLKRLRTLLDTLIARFPASLGGKAASGSLGVTLATDEPLLGRFPASLGQKAKTGAFPVTLSSDEDLLAKFPSTIGQKAKAAAMAVTLASDEDLLAKFPTTIGQKAKAAALAVTLASDEDLIARTPTLGQKAKTGATPVTLASDEDLLSRFPTTLGQKAKTAAFSVTLASDEDLLARTPVLGAAASAASSPVVIATDWVGTVGGITDRVLTQLTATTATTQYTAGDVFCGKVTIANVARKAAGSGVIQDVQLISKVALGDGQFDVLFFNTNPTTTVTDNAGINILAADLTSLEFVAHITDWTPLGDGTVGMATNLGAGFKLPAGRDLFAIIITRGTPTLLTNTDVYLLVHVLGD